MYHIVKTYLLSHPALAIHGLGEWSVTYRASQLHPVLRTFTTPGHYVHLNVNPDITTSPDFIALAMEQWQVSEIEAQERIAAFVKEINETLAQGKDYTFGTIGRFVNSNIGKMEFESELDADFSPESFGLENFEIPQSTITETSDTQAELVATPEETTENKRKKGHKFSILTVISVLLILLLVSAGILYFKYPQIILKYKQKIAQAIENIRPQSQEETELPSIFAEDESASVESPEPSMVDESFIENTTVDINDNQEDISADMEQSNKVEPICQSQTVRTVNTASTSPSDETAKTSLTKGKKVMNNQPSAAVERSQNIPAGTSAQKSGEGYYIVLGSFKSEGNAEAFLKNKSGQYADICHLGQGKSSGLFMVGIGPYSHDEAQQKIVNDGIKGWILKK